MFLLTITAALLSVLYGLAWHNQPARQRIVVRTANRKHEHHE